MYLLSIKRAAALAALAALVASCSAPSVPPTSDPFASPAEQTTGVPPLSGELERSKLTMTSVISVDLDRNVARVPLFRGSYNGATVWYVRMDVSDAGLARKPGLNFAPRLANADNGCPACVQSVTSAHPVLGRALVAFAGTVDFSRERVIVPSDTGFLPLTAQPGSVAEPGYSDLVRVAGSSAVFNAPIVATGDGPFDVSEAHSNTHDRVMAIDTEAMTVDLQFIRAFSHGKDIFYFSFGSSGALSATLERGTFTPVLGTLPFAHDEDPERARSAIFAFTDGKRGELSPPRG